MEPRPVNANGLALPTLGQGGWNIGDAGRGSAISRTEAEAIRVGVGLGMSLIDTAEMYGAGRSEELIGEALRGVPRDSYVLVSKVLPQNAVGARLKKSLDASLMRLRADCLDLYLLHWRGAAPLDEVVGLFEEQRRAGKIRRWGVSNFDVSDMEELWAMPEGTRCAVDQVLYNITSRGVEFDLLPWLAARKVAAMAYCPIAQAGALARMGRDILGDPAILAVARARGASPLQVALAFTIRNSGVCAIPKASTPEHVRENARASALAREITSDELAMLDKSFPPPDAKMHLDID